MLAKARKTQDWFKMDRQNSFKVLSNGKRRPVYVVDQTGSLECDI